MKEQGTRKDGTSEARRSAQRPFLRRCYWQGSVTANKYCATGKPQGETQSKGYHSRLLINLMKHFTTAEGKHGFLFNKMTLDTFWRLHKVVPYRWGRHWLHSVHFYSQERVISFSLAIQHFHWCSHYTLFTPIPPKRVLWKFSFSLETRVGNFDSSKTQVKLETKDAQNFSRGLNKVAETVNRLLWIVFRVKNWAMVIRVISKTTENSD